MAVNVLILSDHLPGGLVCGALHFALKLITQNEYTFFISLIRSTTAVHLVVLELTP